MSILIASHVGLIRRSLQQQLEVAGHKVQTAESPTKALEILAEDARIAIVIVEWRFCDSTAYDLLRKVQKINRLADDSGECKPPHFIVLTTPDGQSGHSSMTFQAKTVGFDDVFEKPIDRTHLLQRIRAVLTDEKPAPSLDVDDWEASLRDSLASNPPGRSPADVQQSAKRLAQLLAQIDQANAAAQQQIDRLSALQQELNLLSAELTVAR